MGADRINVSEQSYSIQGQVDTPILTGNHKHVMDDAEWDRLCKGLDALGKAAVERGFKLCFHHHMGTVVQTAAETDRMMANTDPRYPTPGTCSSATTRVTSPSPGRTPSPCSRNTWTG